jgi:hypothetical protein
MAARHPIVQRFFATDYPRTLFPLSTNEIVVEHAAKELEEHIYQRVLNDGEKSHAFLAQQRVYASKPNYHLRRTVKLDPVAEYFIYDLAYRNRSIFRKSTSENRRSFGYRFSGGEPVTGADAYADFKKALAAAKKQYAHALSFDIAAYFNSIYHHDIVHWFRDVEASPADVDALSQFLLQINSGRSVDCLPHGLYPCKMIGNAFLWFVDSSARLKSRLILRFMDDFHLFDDNIDTLIGDFFQIQKLLGEKGLSVNPRKTRTPGSLDDSATTKIDTMKADLLRMRRAIITASGVEEVDDDDGPPTMTKRQRKYLIALLKEETISEEDAELVLRLMQPYADEVIDHLQTLIGTFPNLAKEIHRFCAGVSDKNKTKVAEIVLEYVRTAEHPTEFVLFWLGKLVEDSLLTTPRAADLLFALYQCDAATKISKAKILEIPDKRFGMVDLRAEHLKTGQSDWLSWSAAVGTRCEKVASRNYVLKYFCTGSEMNHIVGGCILALR